MGRLSTTAKAARLAEASDLLGKGLAIGELASRWGIDIPGARRFLVLNGLSKAAAITRRPRGAKAAKHKMVGNEPRWQNADPSGLTADQLDHALRMGIKPSRYAWLLTCPKGGNAVGWKGGNSIG